MLVRLRPPVCPRARARVASRVLREDDVCPGARMSLWIVAEFLRPASELLATADDLRAAGDVVAAGHYGFAAFMHAQTRGMEETSHGKLLMPQYSLSEANVEKAMRLFADGAKADSAAFEEFSSWFNEEIQQNVQDGDVDRDLASTMFFEAVTAGDEERVRLLIRSGANVNQMGRDGSVLDAASVHGHLQIVRMLVEAGADPVLANAHNSTALHGAAYYGRTRVLRALVDAVLARGRSVDLKDENGNTPLVAAATAGSPSNHQEECVRMLLDAGADASPAFNTGSHESVLPMIREALDHQDVGTAADYASVGRRRRAEYEAVEERWEAAMGLVLEEEVLTGKEFDALHDKVTSLENDQVGAMRMTDQLKQLEECKLGTMHRVGSRVCIGGLSSKPALNGECGLIVKFDQLKGRYAVQLQRGTTILARSRNLEMAMVREYEEIRAASDVSEEPMTGSLARIDGLAQRADLNGGFCEVGRFDAGRGRYACEVKGCKEKLWIRPEHLTRVERVDEDGVARGAMSCHQASSDKRLPMESLFGFVGNIDREDVLESIDPEALKRAKTKAEAASQEPPSTDLPPLLDADTSSRASSTAPEFGSSSRASTRRRAGTSCSRC